MKRVFIFDFDGTLVDTAPDIAYHANEVLRRRGYKERSLADVKMAIGWGVHELLTNLTPGGVWTRDDLDHAVTEFKNLYFQRPVIHTSPYPGVEDVLRGKLFNYQKAILTNKPHALTVSILDQLGLTSSFNYVLGEGNGYPKKPDPAGAFFLLKKLSAKSADAILIGDSHIDQETARNAGMDFAWMNYGYCEKLKDDPTILKLSSATEWESLTEFKAG